jgi:hypothetical protein
MLDSIGEMFFFPDRGKVEEMIPQKISCVDDFNKIYTPVFHRQLYVVPAHLLDSVVLEEIKDNKRWINFRSCPVIEYCTDSTPEKSFSEGITKIGRLALFYYDEPFVTKAMQKIARKLKAKTEVVPPKGYYNFFAFENARKYARVFHGNGMPEPNPFNEQTKSNS